MCKTSLPDKTINYTDSPWLPNQIGKIDTVDMLRIKSYIYLYKTAEFNQNARIP